MEAALKKRLISIGFLALLLGAGGLVYRGQRKERLTELYYCGTMEQLIATPLKPIELILGKTILEGETIVVLAGLAAHQGYLVLTRVILAAFLGSLDGDQLFFYLGRKHSQAVLTRRPTWKQTAEKVHKLMNRFQTPMILSFRFLYGLHTVAPFVIGMSSVSVKKFILLNAAGALVWATAIASGGYFFRPYPGGFDRQGQIIRDLYNGQCRHCRINL